MGLKDYKEYKRRQQFEQDLINYLGVSIDELKDIITEFKELKKNLSAKQEQKVEKPLSDKEKEAKKLAEGKTTPDDFIKQFTSEIVRLN